MERLADVLAHVPETPRPERLYNEGLVQQIESRFGARVADWARSIGREATLEVYSDVSPSRFEMLQDIIGATNESISLSLISYLDGAAAAEPRVTKAQRETIVNAVREGIDQSRQVASLRRVKRRWSTAFTELIVRAFPAEEAPQLLIAVETEIGRYFDALVDQNVRLFRAEEERQSERRMASQRVVIDRALGALPVDERQFADVIGAPADSFHQCCIVSSAGLAGFPGVTLDFASFRQAFQRGFHDLVVTALPADRETSWFFISGRRLARADLRTRIAEVTADVPGALISVGLARHGIDGLRISYASAAAAHRLNLASSKTGPIVEFESNSIVAILLAEPELAQATVAAELGPLLGEQHEHLRTTLRVLLEHGGSSSEAAAVLFLHRNTIAHRIARLRELLGRDPLARPIETHAALVLAELFDR